MNLPVNTLAAHTGAQSRNLYGMGWMLLSAMCLTAVNACIRQLAHDIHPFEVVFLRASFGLLAMAPVFLRKGFAPLRTQKMHLHIARCVIHTISMLMFFYALSMTPLAKATALKFTAPLFACMLAVVFLGEGLRARRVVALLMGFAGTWIVLRPGVAEFDLGGMWVILAAAVFAVAMIFIKILSRTESSLTSTAYMGIFVTPLSLAVALPYWTWPEWHHLPYMIAFGVLGTIGQMALAQSFREADASAVLPFDFTKLIWAALFGFMLFGEVPDLWTLIGGAVIFGAVTYIAIREGGRGSVGG